MTSPIERAARGLASLASGGVCHPSDADIEWQGWTPEAHAAFESIDTDELADMLKNHGWADLDEPLTERDLTLIALAVKNWLTGDEDVYPR